MALMATTMERKPQRSAMRVPRTTRAVTGSDVAVDDGLVVAVEGWDAADEDGGVGDASEGGGAGGADLADPVNLLAKGDGVFGLDFEEGGVAVAAEEGALGGAGEVVEEGAIAVGDGGDGDDAGAAGVGGEALGDGVDGVPAGVGVGDGVGGEVDDDAHGLDDAGAVHADRGSGEPERIRRRQGSQSPLGRLVSRRVACQASRSRGMLARRMASQGRATMSLPHLRQRTPVHSARWASRRGSEGEAAGVDAGAEYSEERGDEGVGEQDAGARYEASGEADGTDLADGDGEESEEADGNGGGGDEQRAAGAVGGDERGGGAVVAGGDGFAETADHEQGVVDAETEAEHGGEILDEDGEVKVLAEEAGDGERGGDGELADGDGNERRDEASKGKEEECDGDGDDEDFAVVHVLGAGGADVEVERDFAGELEFDAGVGAAELRFKGVGGLVEGGDEGLYRAGGGIETNEDEGASAIAEEDRVMELEVGDDSGDAGLVFDGGDDGGEGLLSLRGVGGGQALDDEDDTVDEGRVEVGGEFVGDGLGLAAFDTRGRFEMALCVEGKWKKGEDGYQYDSATQKRRTLTPLIMPTGCSPGDLSLFLFRHPQGSYSWLDAGK